MNRIEPERLSNGPCVPTEQINETIPALPTKLFNSHVRNVKLRHFHPNGRLSEQFNELKMLGA